VKYANCGASVKSSGKVKKMNSGGFMKIGDGLQKLDVNKDADKVKANRGKAVKKKKPKMAYSSGGMAQKKREDKLEKEDKKGEKKYKRGELVEASYGKSVRKKKK
jgi:hypothetical protein